MPENEKEKDLEGHDKKEEDKKEGEEGAKGERTLESADPEVLISLIRDLRKENAARRTELSAKDEESREKEKKLEQALSRLKEIEDATKTEDEKAKEALETLRAKAEKVDRLQRYEEAAKKSLEAALSGLDDLPSEKKAAVEGLLGSFQDEDYLGKLNALNALAAVAGSGSGDKMNEKDVSNPGEKGGGSAGIGYAGSLSLFGEGALKEGKLAGLITKEK